MLVRQRGGADKGCTQANIKVLCIYLPCNGSPCHPKRKQYMDTENPQTLQSEGQLKTLLSVDSMLHTLLQIFEERMTLIKKWVRSLLCIPMIDHYQYVFSLQYSAWDEGQRWTLLEYLLRQQNDSQLLLIHSLLHPTMLPPDHDFTRVLPRYITLNIFSLLDPQSLCRAAQVSTAYTQLNKLVHSCHNLQSAVSCKAQKEIFYNWCHQWSYLKDERIYQFRPKLIA